VPTCIIVRPLRRGGVCATEDDRPRSFAREPLPTVLAKLRKIFAADFRDRVVHHLLVRRYVVPGGFRRVRDQYRWFRRQFPHDVLLIGEQAQPGMPIRGRWPTARVAWHEAENKQ